MVHDPCFIACGALWDQAQFVICLRRVLGTSPLEGNLVSAFLRVLRGRRLFSSWNIQMDSKALHASLFCFGLSGRKEMVRWRQQPSKNVKKKKQSVNKAKQQLCTCITLFCTFRCRHRTTATCKCVISTFHGGRKQAKTKFSPSSLTS